MKHLYLLLIAALALLSSCDRYKHDYTAPVMVNYAVELFTPLQTAFDQSDAADISPVMVYYADDYLHFGVSKSDWELALRTMLTGVANPVFEVIMGSTLDQGESNALANWQLKITDPATSQVIADSIFVGERLVKREGKWLLKGNQMTCEPPVGKQLVIAEYFTQRSCQDCPLAEAKLKELEMQYPESFVYLEQHTGLGLQIPEDTTPAYYSAIALPASVFNGGVKVVGSNAQNLATYQSQVDALVQVDTPIRYQIQSAPVLNGREFSGAVQLTPLIALDQSDMVLNYVIIEEESPYFNFNTPTVKLHNVVLAKGSMSLNGVNLANPVSFSHTSTQDLPEDIRLIIFAQKKPAAFHNDATIYGGIDVPLIRKGTNK